MVPIRYLLSTPDGPGGNREREGDSKNVKRRQLIAAAVEQSEEVLSDEGGCPANYDDHYGSKLRKKMDGDLTAVCPKAISLEEALRRCRLMSVSETVASFNVTAANGDDDSESIQWKRTPGGVAKK